MNQTCDHQPMLLYSMAIPFDVLCRRCGKNIAFRASENRWIEDVSQSRTIKQVDKDNKSS